MVFKNVYLIIFLIIFFNLFEGCRLSLRHNEDFLDQNMPDPNFPLLAEVLMHIQLDYLNQEKLNPKILLSGALTELERNLPELWIYSKHNYDDKTQFLKIEVGDSTKILPFEELNGILELNKLLQTLLKDLIEMRLNLSAKQIEKICIKGILERLDGYSVLLPREIYRDFNINIDGHFAGVGLVVGMREGFLTVISPMDGSPAARAGIQPFDRIVEVNKEKTENLTLEEILHRLRGELGTSVNLTIFRKGNANALNFVLLREEIKVESVKKFDFFISDQKYRLIRVKNFQIGTSQEFKNKMNNLAGIDGLILDLRNNPGGLLEEAVKISDIFLSGKQLIVSTRGSSISETHESKKLFSGEFLEEIPLVVLINRGSASASEILAASLKQNKRAILIGERSFGKGTIQTLWDLQDGSGLKLTIGEYLTPSGNSIQNIGVEPSISLQPVYITGNNNKGILHRKESFADLRFRLFDGNDLKKNNQSTIPYRIRYLRNNKSKIKSLELVDEQSYKNLIKSDIFVSAASIALKYWSPGKNNLNFKKKISDLESHESKKIFRKLFELGIDWSKNEFVKSIFPEDLEFIFETEQISSKTLSLNVKIDNKGKSEANRLIAVTKSNNALLDGLEFPIGKVLPGRSRTHQLKVKFNSGMMQEKEIVEIVLFDQDNNFLKSARKKLNFLPRRNLSFKLKTKIFDNGKLDSIGNGDGKIQNGETIALSFDLVSQGKDVVPELLMKISGTDGNFRINRGKIILKNLKPYIARKDYFLFQNLTNTKNLGKIILEILDTKSGNPKILRKWDLNKEINEQEEVTPIINYLKIEDNFGNSLEGETNLNSVIIKGEVQNSSNLQDIFIHLNSEKVFYSKNEDTFTKSLLNRMDFQFRKNVKLVRGENKISVFARNLHGTISERRISISLKE